MQKVLITGSSGFTGGHLIHQLSQIPSVQIVGIDLFPKHFITEYKMDILQKKELSRIMNNEQPDVVIHLSGITKSDNFQDYYKSNVYSTINVLDSIVENNLNNCKILLASSSAVYGTTKSPILKEEGILCPINFYGNSKVAMEYVAAQYIRNFSLIINIVRPFNIIGQGQSTSFVIPSFASQLLAIKKNNTNSEINVGNLQAIRDFVDITDVVNAYWQIINSQVQGEIFNIASGKPNRIEDILKEMIRILDLNVKIITDPSRIVKQEIPEQIGDIQKITSLGWRPQISIEESLKKILEL